MSTRLPAGVFYSRSEITETNGKSYYFPHPSSCLDYAEIYIITIFWPSFGPEEVRGRFTPWLYLTICIPIAKSALYYRQICGSVDSLVQNATSWSLSVYLMSPLLDGNHYMARQVTYCKSSDMLQRCSTFLI